MKNFETLNVIYFCLFWIFVWYQNIQSKRTAGIQQTYSMILTFTSSIGMLIGFGYLIYYGINVVWWVPFLLFILIGVCQVVIEKFLGNILNKALMSILGFIAWPIFAYLMFTTIPINN